MPKYLDIAGQRFGRLVAQVNMGCPDNGKRRWLCVCDCGKEHTAAVSTLTKGHVKSCGCLRVDRNVERTQHGQTHTPEYRAFCDAKARCNNPRHRRWADWGGRGIKFLFTSFEQFFAELGPRPPGTSIDRINNDGNYESGNVRWATRHEQQHNRRCSHACVC